MLHTAPRRRYRRGEVIFHADDLGDAVHIIEKGRVAIRVTTPLGDAATVTVLGPGELFGEGALFSPDARRSATAIALQATETRALDAEEFANRRATDAELDDLLMRALTERMRTTTEHLLEALFVPVEKRVLRRLLTLAHSFGNGDARVVLPLSQDDVASMAGTTRPTANRVLRAAADDGLVVLARNRITVVDREEIARRSR